MTESSTLLLDTGPLLALVNRRDRHHAWARDELSAFRGRLITCEAVLSEAWFLAWKQLSPPDRFLTLIEGLPLHVEPAWNSRVLALLRKYSDQPMSVADASLVALAEAEPGRVVMTIDRRDFTVYRMHGRKDVPTLMPPP